MTTREDLSALSPDEIEAVEKPAGERRGRREEVAFAAGLDADGETSAPKRLLQATDAVAPVFVAEERLVVVDELADLFFFSTARAWARTGV